MPELDPFIARTAEHIRRHGLLRPSAVVLAACSGGADSVALAAVLVAIGGWRVHLGYVHHGLRPQAAADERFVAELAERWHVPVHLERIDTPALAEQWGVGTEEAARRGRYEALSAVAGRIGAAAVAVAHHADDQAETVLHRALRGTHLRGLSGMPVQRPLAGRVRLIRPILWARRAEVEDFCRRQGLSWQTDHTNAESDYTRNFIRNELLPEIRRRVNPRADEALVRLAAAAAEAQQALDELAARTFERACRRRPAVAAGAAAVGPARKHPHAAVVLRLAPLLKIPAVVAATVLRQALAELDAPEKELTQERFAELLAVAGGERPALDLPGGLRAERRGQDLWLTRRG